MIDWLSEDLPPKLPCKKTRRPRGREKGVGGQGKREREWKRKRERGTGREKGKGKGRERGVPEEPQLFQPWLFESF